MARTVWITGATSGIGREFARRYAGMNCRLLLTSRDEQALQPLVEELETPCRILPGDLTDPRQRKELLAAVSQEPIHVFINNAGVGVCGPFAETDTDKELALIRLNVEAMHHLFKEILKQMQVQGFGTILNVGSSAGLMPAGPYMAAYYASKAYIVSLTRAVARELKENKSRIYTAVLCPGPVDTDFNTHAGAVSALKGITAEYCVDQAIKGMHHRKTVIIPSLFMQVCTSAQKLLPDTLLIPFVGHQQKKKIPEDNHVRF